VYCATRAAESAAVIVVTVTCATWLMDASASPRNPKVPMLVRSSYFRSLEVVKRSHKIGMSAARMPWPSSSIRSIFRPPPFTVMAMCWLPASRQFSINSLSAFAGRTTTSPAAMRLMTDSSSCTICPGPDLAAASGAAPPASPAWRAAPAGAAPAAGQPEAP